MSEAVFSRLSPDQIPGLWKSYLQEGVDHLYQLSKGIYGWKPNDVYMTLKEGISAFAVIVYVNKQQAGFMVIRPLVEEFTRVPYLHIWLAWLKPEYQSLNGELVKQGWAWVEGLAKKNQAEYIEMNSHRMGWLKRMAQVGMKMHRVTYRKEV